MEGAYSRLPGSDIEMAGLAISPSNTNKHTMKLTVPPGSAPGMSLRVEVDGLESQVPIPAGVRPGDAFEAEIPGAAPPVVVATAVPSDEEVGVAGEGPGL